MNDEVAGVVLAAGAATRMGGRHKLLLPLAGMPLVRHAAAAVRAAVPGDLVVVLGREPDSVREALAGLGARFTVNDRFEAGLATSFAAGAAAAGNGPRAVLFALGDQPFVPPGALREMIATFAARDVDVVAARYGSVVAPPYLVRRELVATLGMGHGGVRALIARAPERCAIVDLPSRALADVDTPADYERVLALAAEESASGNFGNPDTNVSSPRDSS